MAVTNEELRGVSSVRLLKELNRRGNIHDLVQNAADLEIECDSAGAVDSFKHGVNTALKILGAGEYIEDPCGS